MISTARKVAQPLVQNTKRSFQTHGTRDTGFDRMFLDKLHWFKGTWAGGNLFTLFGIGSVIGYGLNFVMEKENYRYYFEYTGSGALF